jgi:hypothetical protein
MTAAHLPALAGRDLSGRAVRLPDDLPAAPTLLLVGFLREQQRDLDAWAAALPDVDVLEVVLIPADQERRASLIEGGMSLFARDPDVRTRTWCLYGDVQAAVTSLGVPDRSAVLAIVAGPDGAVQAMAAGPPTTTAVQALEAALCK